MKLQTATDLIANTHFDSHTPQIWADLGSGKGTFTQALAAHLAAGSEIYALDEDRNALLEIPPSYQNVQIHKTPGNFGSIPPELPQLHGILMANSFHYVADKKNFIQLWEKAFIDTPTFLIVEYDTARANPWVPFPLTPQKLEQLFREMGYRNIAKLREIPSLYHNKIYATYISR